MIDKIGDPLKIYKSFQEQLEDDKDMLKLGIMYGLSNEEQKQFIFEKIDMLFRDYGPEYVRVAYKYLEYVGGMALLKRELDKRLAEEKAKGGEIDDKKK